MRGDSQGAWECSQAEGGRSGAGGMGVLLDRVLSFWAGDMRVMRWLAEEEWASTFPRTCLGSEQPRRNAGAPGVVGCS